MMASRVDIVTVKEIARSRSRASPNILNISYIFFSSAIFLPILAQAPLLKILEHCCPKLIKLQKQEHKSYQYIYQMINFAQSEGYFKDKIQMM